MKRIFMLLLVAMIAALSIGIGVAVAEKPEGDNGGKPSDPPCDSNHGHPLENFIRQGRGDRCPTDDGDHGGNGSNGGRPSNPPCDSNDGHPLENFIRQGRGDRCPTDDGGNGDDGNDGGNGDGNGDGNAGGDDGGNGGAQTTCSEDTDGDGEPHSALAPDNDETGLVSGIVHSVDRTGPIPPVTGDQSLVAEVNCALVAGLGL